MITPATLGPTSRAALNMDEFKAIALPRSFLSSISVMTNAWRPGMSNAFTMPWNTLTTISHGIEMVLRQGERREDERDDHRRGLRSDQQAMTVPAVDEDAGKRREQERRELRREADDTEQQRRIR